VLGITLPTYLVSSIFRTTIYGAPSLVGSASFIRRHLGEFLERLFSPVKYIAVPQN